MGKNTLLKKGNTLFIAVLLLGINIITATGSIVQHDLSCSYDWPMYQHDAANTGFSHTTFPNAFNLSWYKSYSELSNLPFSPLFSSPIIANGKIFILGGIPQQPLICALSENNGSLIWKREILPIGSSGSLVGSNSPAVYDGKVFVCLGSFLSSEIKSKIIAIDENTGNVIWEKTFSGTSAYSSVTTVDDKVIVGGHFTFFIPISRVYIFDANNGDLIWHKTILGYLETTPVVSDDKVIVVTGRLSGVLFGLLTPLWSGRSRIYAFDINDGSRLWMKRIKGHVIFSSPAIANGKLFIPSNIIIGRRRWDRRIYTLDLETGKEIWHRHIEQKLFHAWPTSIPTPSVAYDKVFLTDTDGRLFAFDEENGNTIWEKEIIEDAAFRLSYTTISPVVADQKVIVTAKAGNGTAEKFEICMFNESDGERIWNIELAELADSMTPFAIANEKLFVNGPSGIYVFG